MDEYETLDFCSLSEGGEKVLIRLEEELLTDGDDIFRLNDGGDTKRQKNAIYAANVLSNVFWDQSSGCLMNFL